MWHPGLERGQEDVGAALPHPTAGRPRAVLPGTDTPLGRGGLNGLEVL